jgi:hypothetical protein
MKTNELQRYGISWRRGVIEPSNIGKWCKYEDVEKLQERVRVLTEALKKAEFIIVENECDECGTYTNIKYHIKPVSEALKKSEAE